MGDRSGKRHQLVLGQGYDMGGDREDIIGKIKKLLAHSVENGATEAEAIAFALKAQKLIAEHDVEAWELDDGGKQEVIECMTEKHYARKWREFLAVTVADNFRCKAFFESRRENGSQRRKTHVVFVGYECDTKAAAIVFDHLYEVGDRLGRECRKRIGHPMAYDNFVFGFDDGVRTELEKQCQALMLVCPQKVTEYMDGLELKNAIPYRKVYRFDGAYEEGAVAGREAVRSRRMEDSHPGVLCYHFT